MKKELRNSELEVKKTDDELLTLLAKRVKLGVKLNKLQAKEEEGTRRKIDNRRLEKLCGLGVKKGLVNHFVNSLFYIIISHCRYLAHHNDDCV